MLALGYAARIYPTIWAGMATDHPTGCHLTLDEAFAFLIESAWVLGDAGYTVIVPAWWTPEGRRRTKVRLKTSLPLDGRPHVAKDLKLWLGDSRGHWEGNTLVIETKNFRPDTQIYRGGDPATFEITERFTRVNANTIHYEYTINDPHTWTKPWTVMVPWNKIDPDEQMYEYACHEDNYDMSHFLTGARAREKKGEKLQPISQRPR